MKKNGNVKDKRIGNNDNMAGNIKRILSEMKMGNMVLFFLAMSFLFTLGLIALSGENFIPKDYETVEEFNDGWYYRNETGKKVFIEVPAVKGGSSFVNPEEKDKIVLYNTLPDECLNSHAIMIYTRHSFLHVYIDNTLVYEFGKGTNSRFSAPGNSWNIIPLQQELGGKEIRLEISTPIAHYMGEVNGINIGHSEALVWNVIREGKYGHVATLLLLVFTLTMLIMWGISWRSFRSTRLLYLALFSFTVFGWSASGTIFAQLIIGNPQITTIIEYETMMMVPIFLLASFSEGKDTKMATTTKFLFLFMGVSIFIYNYLQFAGIFTLVEMVNVIQIEIFMICLIMAVICFRETKTLGKSKVDNKIDTIGFLLLVIAGLIDFLRYQFTNDIDNTFAIKISLLIYAVMILYEAFNQSMRRILQGKKAEYYQKIAYEDTMTGAKSRAACNEYFYELEHDLERLENTLLLNIDINNLKEINDTYGHDAGDHYIQDNVSFLMKYFGDIGICFRLGGDEFIVVIAPYDIFLFKERLEKMEEALAKKETLADFSFGYAIYNKEDRGRLMRTLKRADKEMYENKKKYRKLRQI